MSPDFVLIEGPGAITVVNVKPADRIGDPKVTATFKWATAVFESPGLAAQGVERRPGGFVGQCAFPGRLPAP